MTQRRKQLLQRGERGVGVWRDKTRIASSFPYVAPRDSMTRDETWVRRLSEAGPTHHFGLGKMRKDYRETERQGLLFLVIMCVCEAGTVGRLALGSGKEEFRTPGRENTNARYKHFSLCGKSFKGHWLGLGVLVLSVLAGRDLETGEDRDRFGDGTGNMN